MSCNGHRWQIDLGEVVARASQSVKRRLPRHDACTTYQIALHDVFF